MVEIFVTSFMDCQSQDQALLMNHRSSDNFPFVERVKRQWPKSRKRELKKMKSFLCA